MARRTGSELRQIRALRAQLGVRRAVAARLKANLDLDGVSGPWVAEAGNQLAQLGPLVPAVGALEARVAELTAELERLRAQPAEPVPAPAPPADRTAEEILTTTAFVAGLGEQDLEVTVITTSRGRPERLRRAIESVRAQTHARWRHLVAIDGGDPACAAVLDAFADERVVRVDRDGLSRGQALNLALEHATGDVVTYLDDDNAMQPHWLAALAWVFGHETDLAFAYGALARQPNQGDTLPFLEFEPWDARDLERRNLVDINCLAHRRGLPGARFDPDLDGMEDWDLVVRLAAASEPRRIPVVAASYRADAEHRLTDRPRSKRERLETEIRRRARAQRPLRVLASNRIFPQITETYIADELSALVAHGAELRCYRHSVPVAPLTPFAHPIDSDWDRALTEFRPDVVMIHWATHAEEQLPRLEAAGLPFGVRVHSFDHDDERIRMLLDHPLCVGVWSFPSATYALPGTHAMPPLFTSVDRLPAPAPVRETVLSISAGLPKKDWPLLFDAFGRLPGIPRRVVVGLTNGFLETPAELAERAAQIADPPLVQVNLARREALSLLAETSVLVYTLAPGVRFGMPMCVAEALCAGCCVVLPDRPECREYAGPGFRGYRTAEDIAQHVRHVAAGGPAIAAEREANMAYGRERFCDPELGRRFYEQLRTGVEAFHGAPVGATAAGVAA